MDCDVSHPDKLARILTSIHRSDIAICVAIHYTHGNSGIPSVHRRGDAFNFSAQVESVKRFTDTGTLSLTSILCDVRLYSNGWQQNAIMRSRWNVSLTCRCRCRHQFTLVEVKQV